MALRSIDIYVGSVRESFRANVSVWCGWRDIHGAACKTPRPVTALVQASSKTSILHTFSGRSLITDVVVHPIKAFTHYADISVSDFTEEPHSKVSLHPTTPSPNSSPTSVHPSGGNTRLPPKHSPDSRHTPPPQTSKPEMLNIVSQTSPAQSCQSQKKVPKYSSTLHVNLSTQRKSSEHTTAKSPAAARQPPSLSVLEAKGGSSTACAQDPQRLRPVPLSVDNKSSPRSAGNSFVLDDAYESDDEESVSVTTGRLSLSLSSSSINVKSEVIQTEQVATVDHGDRIEPNDKTNEEEGGSIDRHISEQGEESAAVGGGRKQVVVVVVVLEMVVAVGVTVEVAVVVAVFMSKYTEKCVSVKNLTLVNMAVSEDEESLEAEAPEEQEEPAEPDEPEGAQGPEVADAHEDTEDGKEKAETQLPVIEPGMLQTRTGPVTIQKASVIVGKAIAKAMARESSVRESHSGSQTPEHQEAPMATPESSEGEEETQGTVSVYDSDSDDQLHILDTIPEEGNGARVCPAHCTAHRNIV
ncbi:hypothetical protein E2C01_000417 [Portunus trituberculatus]|uniref:Uncharacterized protein n=1 Tax=Portunus trituberculatus TaxID=210409 RepID=A0A5B7CF56_PORTR|nr:hypothetical protein [Portunus trituberculatus]